MVKTYRFDERLGRLESLLDLKPVLPIHIYYKQHNQSQEQAIQVYAGGNGALYKQLLNDEADNICIEVMPVVSTVKVTRGGKHADR